ncbi:MAG: hypothetical protein CVU03_07135 [Bacteroidetes bacterium HGW-Bacteroidetes-2]|jgi:uncharacterized hydrophobic protein (TIGR00271 family)|nr:MAG: hypothetical protein CVU03_07135 [Bacteroidetes bacterium HGW-Bacteroidetes-2]
METNSQNNSENKSAENLKNSAQNTFGSIKIFFTELLDIRHDTDTENTVEAIKKEISFKAHNAWILIFSIFVASIGLNVSSAAVVIGAMLISPLMGPIVGIGMSVAINDVDTLRRSLINLGVMILLSVLTAYLYFLLSPLTKLTPELEARTYPTILDVLVAIFGGLALIVAKTKKGTIASVIFGVAIATALMPPLCTAGYGLAVGNMEYFFGAFYLFTINSIFIALSTFLVAKLLGFPLVRYANSQRRRRIAQIATTIAIVVMIPSALLFWELLNKEIFITNTTSFVDETVHHEGTEMLKVASDYDTKMIEIYLIGRPVSLDVISSWQSKLENTDKLKEVKLKVYQGADQSSEISERLSTEVRAGILSDLYTKNQEVLQSKESQIQFLENQLARMTTAGIPFDELSKEIKINYQNLTSISYANTLKSNFSKVDTIPQFMVSWDESLSETQKEENQKKLKQWLIFRLKMDNIVMKEL